MIIECAVAYISSLIFLVSSRYVSFLCMCKCDVFVCFVVGGVSEVVGGGLFLLSGCYRI